MPIIWRNNPGPFSKLKRKNRKGRLSHRCVKGSCDKEGAQSLMTHPPWAKNKKNVLRARGGVEKKIQSPLSGVVPVGRIGGIRRAERGMKNGTDYRPVKKEPRPGNFHIERHLRDEIPNYRAKHLAASGGAEQG